ncbi:hypothetical protein P886_1265 [Alteromonadaceae bacterium 2753L.S.0a.02]|nr:hypothetical protein P886_1265 [Alteromonadaceae bacterium 2753L.S.0a.02]
MNSLILNELVAIKWILCAILGCIIIIVLWFIMNMVYTFRNRKAELESAARNSFLAEAHQYEDAGQFDKLFELAWDRNNNYPHDPNAHWFMAISRYRRKEWGAALASFKELQRLDPAWQKYTVEEYIEEIKQNLTGPKG